MRQRNDRTASAENARSAPITRRASGWSAWTLGVSLLAMSCAATSSAQAQGDFVVDVTDPNVSVDLSVLNDGGLGPRMDAPMPATSATAPVSGGYRTPGPKAPVSTLYVQPSDGFHLPPQTKPLIAQPAPTVPAEAQIAVDEPAATPPVMEPEQAETAAVPAPPPPAAVVPPAPIEEQPTEQAQAEPAPQPAPEPQETAAAEPVPTPAPQPAEQAAAAPEPQPVEEVAKAEPAPAPVPAAEPVSPPPPAPAAEAAPEAQTPAPPPPQVLGSAQAPSIDETQTAPQPMPPKAPVKSGAVVVDLPPKVEDAEKPAVASLPPATGALGDGDSMRIVFEHDSSKLPADARDALLALSERLAQQEDLRLQLLAYAGDADTSASAARRLSLSRALAVRSFLIENGVRSTRIDVRALGNKSTEEITERVDITVVER